MTCKALMTILCSHMSLPCMSPLLHVMLRGAPSPTMQAAAFFPAPCALVPHDSLHRMHGLGTAELLWPLVLAALQELAELSVPHCSAWCGDGLKSSTRLTAQVDSVFALSTGCGGLTAAANKQLACRRPAVQCSTKVSLIIMTQQAPCDTDIEQGVNWKAQYGVLPRRERGASPGPLHYNWTSRTVWPSPPVNLHLEEVLAP